MKKCVVFLALVLLLLSISCTKKNREMTILTENYPPLSYAENGVVTGFGAEVVAAIQKELKTNSTPVLLKWDEAYQRALSEPNVLIFTIEKTPEREGKFNFIGPLGANTTYFYALAESKIDLADLEAAKQVTSIATTTNWFSEQLLMEKGFTNLYSKADPVETLKMLTSKEADLAIFTDISFPQLCQVAGVSPSAFKPVLEVLQSEYYIAISKSTDPKDVLQWEKAFVKLSADGTLASLKNKWFPQ
ncbi:MAG TPA: transporter substrate-binding domain-containing protein [Candidatus Cloacimonas sp.]|nr:transporter substrate-binding domain-containing protein [Candidatus Cloacimonas sp.]